MRPGNEAHITKKLRKFGSDNVTWKIKSDPERPAWGATEKTNGKTCIFINKAFVQLLGSDSNHTSAEKMFASLALAEVILHELANAFWIVTRFRLEGRLRDEPYFEGQHFNELGHALITSLFGGAISMRLPDDQPARAGELPRYGLQIQHLYDGVTPSFAAKVNFRAHREFVVRWIVGMLWMEKLFTQAFWDGEVQVRWKGLSPSSKETWVEASESYLVGLGKK